MAGEVLDRIRAEQRVTIAHRERSVPLSYVANGRPVGYALDICMKLVDAIKADLGLPRLAVNFVQVDSASRLASIVSGKADLECGSTTNNEARRKQVAFTIPHYVTGARYLVLASSPIQDLGDFRNRSLASTKGTTPLEAINHANKDRMLDIRIMVADDHEQAVSWVDSGRVDGFVMDDVLLYGLKSQSLDPSRFKIVGRYLTVEALSIMFSKNDVKLKAIIDAEMRRLIMSREAYAIYDKWFNSPIPPNGRNLGMPMSYLLRDFWKYPTDQVPN